MGALIEIYKIEISLGLCGKNVTERKRMSPMLRNVPGIDVVSLLAEKEIIYNGKNVDPLELMGR